MPQEITIDIRVLFAEQLSELFQACVNVIEERPGDPRLSELRHALDKFTRADPFEVPLLAPCEN